MKKVVIERSKDFKKKREYDIFTDSSTMPYCTIRASDKPPIQSHYIIEAYHSLGGGFGGWNSYIEEVDLAHGKKDIPKQLRLTAILYAQKLAKRLGASLEDRL